MQSTRRRTKSQSNNADQRDTPGGVAAAPPAARKAASPRSVPPTAQEAVENWRKTMASSSDTSSTSSPLHLAYYRLYWKPSAALPSLLHFDASDPSLATFYLEHVPPPRKGKNYIAFICAREKIHVSRVKLYVNEGSMLGEERLRLVDRDEVLRRGPNECGTSSANPLLVTVEMAPDAQGQRNRGDAAQPLPLVLRTSRSLGNLVRRRKNASVAEQPPVPAAASGQIKRAK
ncbi:hypothetical protein FRC04_004191 [Tulasnella sp. 424]|nr:hypothetical protein FRC04_004191 [Tulasnella sp. 424]KAG8981216.1 hypothetical protein FRC05_004118 [Tulasnella sp. 425]